MNQPQLFDVAEEFESEDDSYFDSKNLVAGIMVTDTDWTTETILNQISKENIYLNPSFQRREAWDDKRKSKFIESLILGIPIPQLVIAENKNAMGKFLVIDGKQRLLALMRFTGANQSKPLKLKGLEIRSDLNGKTFDSLKSDPDYYEDVSAFENSNIRTTVIKGWKDERALYLIFLRLNSGSVALSPQELRHALHPGKFIDFAVNFSEQSPELIGLLGKDGKPDFRMRDVELLIRFYGLRLFLNDYKGDLKYFLDQTVDGLNKTWESREKELRDLASQFERAITFTRTIFDKNAYSKWIGNGFESRFNRAVFDAMCYYFANEEVRHEIVEKNLEKNVLQAFKSLCESNADFIKSIESTTKSKTAVFTRLVAWGEVLESTLKKSIPELTMVRTSMQEDEL